MRSQLLEELGEELCRPVPKSKVGNDWVFLWDQKEASVLLSLFSSTVPGLEDYGKKGTVEIG